MYSYIWKYIGSKGNIWEKTLIGKTASNSPGSFNPSITLKTFGAAVAAKRWFLIPKSGTSSTPSPFLS